MKTDQQRDVAGRPRHGAERARARRAELLAVGRSLFADTPYDALSMDDIAREAQVAKGLIYYYFTSKRGYYLAIVEDAVGGLIARAESVEELPPGERAHRTVDGYLSYAERHRSAYRTLVSGGVGFDVEVRAIRDGVREAMIDVIAEGAYGHRDLPPTARLALLGWLWSVEGVTLDWLGRGEPDRDTVRRLLVRTLEGTLQAVEEFTPGCPAPDGD
ncbi:TetR/AcrR family transcriptional regulator [Streptomyces tsukubensis]|uniref:TetR family transcriptional regulator n=1 Tax=Streptomyces tsukubensis TaxID=83656 RepID=A0A1V3ZYI3_9ACTN|nr:TetR/AcrR family transcriptional regulator [Streptomyces tsukubensis]OON71414.1 TetR family transcriptional regulator [Streptomyces tsukubensis]